MSDLFLPKDQKGLDELLTPKDVHPVCFDEDSVLVFSHWKNIYVLEDFDLKPIKIRERSRDVDDFCVYEGNLYDSGKSNCIYDTLANDIVCESEDWIVDMCVHQDLLHYCTEGGVVSSMGSSLKLLNIDQEFTSLYEFDGALFAVSDRGAIWNVYDGKIVNDLYNFYLDVCVHEEIKHEVYFANADGKVYPNAIGSPVAERGDIVNSLCVHKGRLLDATQGGEIYDTLSSRLVFNYEGIDYVGDMASIPRHILEGYLK